MPANTANRGITYPVLSDAANVPLYVQQGFTQIDADLEKLGHPAVYVGKMTVSQAINSSAVTAVPLTLGTELIDTHNGHPSSGDLSKYFVVAGQEGLYHASCVVDWPADTTAVASIGRRSGFRIDGAGTIYYYTQEPGKSLQTSYSNGGGILPVYLTAGQYIQCMVLHDASGSLTIATTDTMVSYHRVAEAV